MTAWSEQRNGQFLFLTLTIKHDRSDKLDDLWDAVAGAWTKFSTHYAFKKHRAVSGLEGFLRAVEVTSGVSGWHVHLHVLLFLLEPLSMISDSAKLFTKWSSTVEGLGYRADPGVQDIRFANAEDAAALAGYLNKQGWDSAKELSAQTGKIAKGNSMTPMQILRAAAMGDSDALALWYVWEHCSKGRRQLTYSTGLRKSLGFSQEQADDAIEVTSSMEIAGIRPEFFAMFRHRHEEMAQFLEAAEEADPAVRLRKLRELSTRFDLPLDVGSKWDKVKFASSARGSNYMGSSSESPRNKLLRDQVLKEWAKP